MFPMLRLIELQSARIETVMDAIKLQTKLNRELIEIDKLQLAEIINLQKLCSLAAPGHHPTHQETFTMSVVTTDDNVVRVRPTGLDVDGVKTTPTDLTATIDNPAACEVIADPDNAGAFLIKRLPATDPNAGALTTVATFTTPSGISASVTVEFDPGTEASLALETEIVPGTPAAAAPAGDGTTA